MSPNRQLRVPTGRSEVGVRFRRAPAGTGRATLVIDGRACGQVEIPFVRYIISSIGPSVGYDHGSPVSGRYDSPFAFEGVLDRVDIQIVSARDAAAEAANADAIARAEMARQ
jgi:arylsulfatase